MKTSLRLTKYLGGIVLALILIFTLPGIIVQRANITNNSDSDCIGIAWTLPHQRQ